MLRSGTLRVRGEGGGIGFVPGALIFPDNLRRGVLLAALALMAGLLVVAAPPASAATITPTTLADDFTNNGNCTLREAITAANTDAAPGAVSEERLVSG